MARTLVKAITDKRRNLLINGNFDFWQRGTSLTTTSAYGADRWRGGSAIDTQVRRDRTYSAGLPIGSTYGNEVTSLAGGGTFIQRIEASSLVGLEGKSVTLSFKAGLVSGTTALDITIRRANAPDNWGSNTVMYTSPSLGTPAAHTGTYTTFSYTFTVTQAMVTNGFDVEISGDATVWSIMFSQMMLTEGAPGQEFRLAASNYAGEFELCQRYFEKSYLRDVAPGSNSNPGAIYEYQTSGNYMTTQFQFAADKRTVPTVTLYNTVTGAAGQMRGITGGGSYAIALAAISERLVSTSTNAPITEIFGYHWTADAEL